MGAHSSSRSSHPELVVPLAAVKEAAAPAHLELGTLPEERARSIVAACREIRAGRLHDQFVVDVFQGGAGTSANTNANEVVAYRALEILGHPRGGYEYLPPPGRREPLPEHQRRVSHGGQASPSCAARDARGVRARVRGPRGRRPPQLLVRVQE